MDEKDKRISKLQAVIITLCTVIVGLTSYIFYLSTQETTHTSQRCEYNGWAYTDEETFPSIDGCNTCVCSNGQIACTEMACVNPTTNNSPTCETGGTCTK